MHTTRLLFASLVLSAAACQSAHADRIAPSQIPQPRPVVVPVQAPYSVTIVGEDGRELDTYTKGKRFYVHGQTGQRYAIRVDNPTNRRVEAVVSVDGLDVIDGETADFRNKRGYIVPPRGSVTIDGFRVSTQAVAAFRFSSVSSSYAGRKGKARNVGVVGVALFEEKAQAQMILPRTARDFRSSKRSRRPVPSKPAPRPSFDDDGSSFEESATASADAPRAGASIRPRERRQERPGLGTEFGENRSSAVSFTKFERANKNKPTSIAELRYNNAQGLQALGIRLRNSALVDGNELAIRESASAFPESPYNSSFAKPPR
jgi:hypothetical protein